MFGYPDETLSLVFEILHHAPVSENTRTAVKKGLSVKEIILLKFIRAFWIFYNKNSESVKDNTDTNGVSHQENRITTAKYQQALLYDNM